MSDGLALYHASIVAAARRIEQHPRLDRPTASVTVDNPLCGDRVTTDVTIDGPALARVGHRVRGCLLCEASATLLAELACGLDGPRLEALEQALCALLAGGSWAHPDPRFEPFAMFAPVAAVRSRHRCVMLPFESLAAALVQALATDVAQPPAAVRAAAPSEVDPGSGPESA